jgi:AcrR family transcriptional regulator
MKIDRQSQGERSSATREALVAAGRSLFAARGYADVGTEEIVRTAGVSRGALYHQFADKTELFAAVFEAVEMDVIGRIRAAIEKAGVADPIAIMRLGASAWLDACIEPEIHQIGLLDAPAVLGLARWREISTRYSMGMVEGLLAHAIEVGRLPPQPIKPLAQVLLGMVREGALYLADAADRTQARHDVGVTIDRLIQALGTE